MKLSLSPKKNEMARERGERGVVKRREMRVWSNTKKEKKEATKVRRLRNRCGQ
jgi:hypothetical protein